MDKVRLGRALGYGTRHAARTLAAVAEAAAAPDPRPAGRPQPAAARGDLPRTPVNEPVVEAPRAARRPQRVSGGQLRSAGGSFWKPLATYSGALWLRVTGLFFGLIAFAMANGVWRLRGALHLGAAASRSDRSHLLLFAAFAMLFGYFAVSSFVRANLKERRAQQR